VVTIELHVAPKAHFIVAR